MHLKFLAKKMLKKKNENFTILIFFTFLNFLAFFTVIIFIMFIMFIIFISIVISLDILPHQEGHISIQSIVTLAQ